MAPKRIHTRRFPDPNPPKVVENPERILRRSNTQANKGIFHLVIDRFGGEATIIPDFASGPEVT